MKNLIMILACILASIGLSVAQTTLVSGTVIDDTGETVIGASVVAKGTTVGTVTDIDGKFSLNIPSDKNKLIISLIGYKAKEVTAGANLKVLLEPDSKLIDEVVVTGYGNIKKASFTGAATVISTSKLENIPSVSLSSRLAGAAAGVSAGSSTGQPGAVESVRIRGTGSVNASNEPLYVIDGVPMTVGNANAFTYSQSGNSILSTINANDIESITIIKDAASASLYGSRAANGVILITTKSGKSGKTMVTLRADWGFSDMAVDYRPTLGGDDRRTLLYQGLINRYNNDNPGAAESAAIAYADKDIKRFAEKPETGWENWKDRLFRKGSQQNYEINLQGGNDKTNFYSSLAYTASEGITYQSKLDRVSGRLNLTHKMDKLTFNGNVMFTNSKQQVNSEGSSFSSPLMAIAMTTSPQDYAFNPDGSYNITNKFPALGNNPKANPLYNSSMNYDRSEVNRFLGSTSASYNLFEGLTLKEQISYDYIQSNNSVWWNPLSNDGTGSKGVMQKYSINRKTFISQTHLMYDKTFSDVHNVNALVGYEVEKYKFQYLYVNGNNYPSSQKPEVENAGNSRASSSYNARRMISYVGFANYNYDNRYYFGASFRRDGSSKFAPDSRWGNFWSLSGSWRLTQESFAQSFNHMLSDAKIRFSYGTNGNLPIDNYDYMDIYEFGYKYNGNPGSAEKGHAFRELTWEKNNQLNIGLDFTLLERFNVTFDYYNRKSTDLLLDKTVSQTTGFSNIMLNVGDMTNKGFELTLMSTNIRNKNILWTTTLNLSHNKNELTSIGTGESSEFQRPYTNQNRLIHRVGEPFNSLYAYEYAGVDPKTGKEMFYKNTEGHERETTTSTSQAKQVIIGKVDPTLQGGLTNNITYKDFDLGFTFTFTLGGHLYDNMTWINSNGGSYNYNGNVPAYNKIGDMWQKEGDQARLPQFAYGNVVTASSRWMHSSDHLRLKNITFGYTLPKKVLQSIKLNRARVYASALNLLTFKSSNLNFDPEYPVDPNPTYQAAGVVMAQTPTLRSVTFGIEISF